MSDTVKYIHVKRFKRSVGRQCMRCGKSATVTAVRIFGARKHKLDVRYCRDHATEEIGA